jgi:hypothetical protein
MSANVSWENDRIVRLNVEAPWTWRDYVTAAEAALFMVAQAGGVVDLIMDFEQADHPPGENVLNVIRSIGCERPHNLGLLLIVASPLLQTQLGLLLAEPCAELGSRIAFAASLEEALDLLLERRLAASCN